MDILAVKAELHVVDDDANWMHPLRLQICFRDGSTVRLRGSEDGDGLIVDRLPLEPAIEMGEYGRTDIFDFTDRLDPKLRGEAVGPPVAIRNFRDRLVGLALPRPGGEPFCVWINDDEFHWGSEASLREYDWLDGRPPTLDDSLFAQT